MLQRVTTAERSFVHIFFLDGVGLGGPDATANPFAAARLPNLTGLGARTGSWPSAGRLSRHERR